MIDTLVAIDIALEPDATMMQRSHADNATLLTNFPQGYTLDDTHDAHVSMLQRFVRETDLDNVYAAIAGARRAVRVVHLLSGGRVGLSGRRLRHRAQESQDPGHSVADPLPSWNDGTLWVEHPMYAQLAFVLSRLAELAPQHPEWKTSEPFKSTLAGDRHDLCGKPQRGRYHVEGD